VVFNNYGSNIYGKQNNVWSLTDAKTGQEILNVKSTPYFIYTFTDPGYYTIYNMVEDSWGNVYEISKPGFIEIVDHKVKRPDDRRPDFVDSNDYGYPQLPFSTRGYEFMRLSKDLAEQEAEILIANTTQFGSAVVIPGNPDSTFDSE
jgi:PKD repeat protein